MPNILLRREFLEVSATTAALALNPMSSFAKETSIEDIFPTVPPCKEFSLEIFVPFTCFNPDKRHNSLSEPKNARE